MQILKLAKVPIAGSLLMAGMLACYESPVSYKSVGTDMLNLKVKESLNIMKASSKNVIDNPDYKYYGKDTIEVTSDIWKSYDDYIAKLNRLAMEKNSYSCSELKTVINSDEVYTNSGLDVYIPVEYYGKLN